jgi:hypothetical protein
MIEKKNIHHRNALNFEEDLSIENMGSFDFGDVNTDLAKSAQSIMNTRSERTCNARPATMMWIPICFLSYVCAPEANCTSRCLKDERAYV